MEPNSFRNGGILLPLVEKLHKYINKLTYRLNTGKCSHKSSKSSCKIDCLPTTLIVKVDNERAKDFSKSPSIVTDIPP